MKSELWTFDVDALNQLPACREVFNVAEPRIYFLLEQDVVVYVGKSLSVQSRLRSHRRQDQIEFDRMFVLPVAIEFLDLAERLWIMAFRPKHNRSYPTVTLEDRRLGKAHLGTDWLKVAGHLRPGETNPWDEVLDPERNEAKTGFCQTETVKGVANG